MPLYFAYGSNMSPQRLAARIGDTAAIGVGCLPGYVLRFDKKGRDGSGKCTILQTNLDSDAVYGVVFQVRDAQLAQLDGFEGRGKDYERQQVTVQVDGQAKACLTYIAIESEDGLRPWDWYAHHVLAGAKEAALPPSYIDFLASVPAKPDPDRERFQREMQVYAGD